MKQAKNWLILGLLAFGVAMRVLPYVLVGFGVISATDFSAYAWNISPVPAVCLLAGAYLMSARVGFGVGVCAYILSDVLIHLITGFPFFYKTLPFVYAGFLLYGVLGLLLRGNKSAGRIACIAILSELAFFLLTNFGEWAVGDNQYPGNLSGLLACYVAALPFWKNSLMGMCIYAPVFFGLFAYLDAQKEGVGLRDRDLELVRVRK